MSKDFGKFWYSVSFGSNSDLIMLTYADTLDEAKKIFGIVADGREIDQLTWQGLFDLTGCPIPSTCKDSDMARGNFIFANTSKRVAFWQDIRQ